MTHPPINNRAFFNKKKINKWEVERKTYIDIICIDVIRTVDAGILWKMNPRMLDCIGRG